MNRQDRRTPPIPLMVAIGAGVLGIALAGAWAFAPKKENEPVVLETPYAESNTIPSIDAAVPAYTQTATFALG